MGARKWVVVLTVFALLTGQTSAAITSPAGIVLEAGKARLGNTAALRGATVFTGQQLSTEPGGKLRVQFGEAQIALAGQSAVWLDGEGAALRAVLRTGTAAVAWKNAAALEFLAGEVVLRPRGHLPAHASVTLLNPRELMITSHAGSLEATFAGVTHVIPAGSTHKATLAPQGPQGAGKNRGIAPIVWVAIAAGVATGIGLWLALRDGQQPVSPSVP